MVSPDGKIVFLGIGSSRDEDLVTYEISQEGGQLYFDYATVDCIHETETLLD
jgi:hypothetical protein